MTDDSILELLRQRAAAIRPRSDGEPNIYPIATAKDIEAAESALGVNLPPLLKRVYLEIGNGGCMLGPGLRSSWTSGRIRQR